MATADVKSMPVLQNVPVALSKVLEVRAKPLEEYEVWGLIYKTAEAVQDLIFEGLAVKDGVPQYLVTPDSLQCMDTGDVILSPCSPKLARHWCSEIQVQNFYSNIEDVEKLYVFTIGQTMRHGVYFTVPDKSQRKLTPLIKTVLQGMCQNDVELQMLLSDVSQICILHAAKYMNGHSFSDVIVHLNEETLGGGVDYEMYNLLGKGADVEEKDPSRFCDKNLGNLAAYFDPKLNSYGHRLGYRPPSFSSIHDFPSSQTAKQRWKSAFEKITQENKACLQDEFAESIQGNDANSVINEAYEAIIQRRKLLEQLKVTLDRCCYSDDVVADSSAATDSKPKTADELIALIREAASKRLADLRVKLGCNPDLSLYPSSVEYSSSMGSDYLKPYYNIDRVILDSSFTSKSCIGPEYIIGSLKPYARLILNCDSEPHRYVNSVVTVIVTLLNGEHLSVECLPLTSGRQLYYAIANHLQLQERYLFGLAYLEGGEYFFINRKQKVGELLSLSTSKACDCENHAVHLSFRVKFYLDEIHLMRTQALRHLFYLQLRRNILDDNFNCDLDTAFVLSGLALHAEFGDYDRVQHGTEYFLLEHYMSHSFIRNLYRADTKAKLIEQHENFKGLTKHVVHVKFIQEVIKTAAYGCHFHKVLQDKRNPSSILWLAISYKGIDVYESASSGRRRCQNYPWDDIKRISFSKKYFCVSPRTESSLEKHVVYRFYTSMLHRSRYLFSIAMAHHKFFLKLKSVTKASDIFSEDLDEEHLYTCNRSTPEHDVEKEIGCDLHTDEDVPGSLLRSGPRHGISSLNRRRAVNQTRFMSGTNFKRPHLLISPSDYEQVQRKRDSRAILRSASAPSTFTNVKCLSCASKSPLTKDSHAKAPSSLRRNSSRTQNLVHVRLHKDSDGGLGMVINCGDTYETILHGAFVESICPGGPCDLNGNIRSGDQIMSVNRVDVQNEHFTTVVDLIKHSSSPIELVIAKADKLSNAISLSEKFSEPPFIKTEAWLTGDENPKEIQFFNQNIKNSSYENEPPIPKPRRKWSDKENHIEKLHSDFPDLTLNHSSVPYDPPEKEMDCSIITEHFSRECCSIPDIIASQMKQHTISRSLIRQESFETCEQQHEGMLPGEVYHVVLDKKGGSLGLNIYQGSESLCTQQSHIFIHSIIPGGAAEIDGRIKSGDKLLEVNGVPLENLSYQEVVVKLRESPQVTHLVLEKGNTVFSKNLENDTHNSISNSELETNGSVPKRTDSFHEETRTKDLCFDEIPISGHSILTANHQNNGTFDDGQNFCSLPASYNYGCPQDTKETKSAPSSYQHNENHISKSGSNTDYKSSLSHNYAKVKFQKLATFKSTPNLAEDSEDEETNRDTAEGLRYRNRSTECLMSSAHFLNPHLALIDLHQNYSLIRGSTSNIHQIPAVPIRKKKLRKLEDVLNYCNSENTFTVHIQKSSRGLGLSISGGLEPSGRDRILGKDLFSQLIRIRKLYPLQPALECGKLMVGDVILELNGNSMIGVTNSEALKELRSAPMEVELKVLRPSKSPIPSFSTYKHAVQPFFTSSSSSASSSLSRTENNTYNVENGEFEIMLVKRGGSLGFTIFKKEDSCVENSPVGIYVKSLIREPAVSDGRIHPGDQILQVNGTAVSLMSHEEAISFIRNAPNAVTLKLFRSMDPPLSPFSFEDDHPISKPLRWEAIELLNDRVRQKDNGEEFCTLKRKIKRRADRATSNAPSNSSTESECSSGGASSTQDREYSLVDGPGLLRSQRPKSLDVLNASDRKRAMDEDGLHRQASVMCEKEDGVAPTKKNLIKWRGSKMPDSEDSSEVSQGGMSGEVDEDKPVPYPRTTSIQGSELVETIDVNLDRGWHGRLGFSLCDPQESDGSKQHLPTAAQVKAVYPGSLADKDGRIKVGDRLIEVNGERMLQKSVSEVIDILRKTRGIIRMVFCRLPPQL